VAITYFGHNVNGSDVQPLGTATIFNDGVNIVYTCPGTGSQEIKELGARVYASATGNMRLAVYTTGLVLVAQGDAEIDVAPPSVHTWLSHTAFRDAAGELIAHPLLTGGTA